MSLNFCKKGIHPSSILVVSPRGGHLYWKLSFQFNSFYNLNFPLLNFFKALRPRHIEENRFIPISKEVIDISTITFLGKPKIMQIIASKGTSSYFCFCGRVNRNFFEFLTINEKNDSARIGGENELYLRDIVIQISFEMKRGQSYGVQKK